MWFIAESPGTLAHYWHKTNSVGTTKELGNLAYVVTSRVIVLGSAERHGKTLKAVKTGQRDHNGTIKYKKQSLIYGTIMQKKARCQ